jgi:hypothetical protein
MMAHVRIRVEHDYEEICRDLKDIFPQMSDRSGKGLITFSSRSIWLSD